MPTYILLLNYTDEGMQNIKYLPEHIRAFRQAVDVAGGRVTQVHMTMGEYDLIAVVEAPSDNTCLSIALGLRSLGNLRSTTLKAFGEDDLTDVVKNIPSLEDEFARILRDFRSA